MRQKSPTFIRRLVLRHTKDRDLFSHLQRASLRRDIPPRCSGFHSRHGGTFKKKGLVLFMKKALIVVDYQNDFVSGSLGFPDAAGLEQPICQKIRQYREQGGEVIFTLDTHGENYLQTQEGKKLPIVHCLRGTEGWKLYGAVAQMAMPQDKVFEKPSFGSRELMDYLAQQQFDQVELVGIVSNICVISNAMLAKAALPEAEVMVDAACTASSDILLHQKAMDVMEGVQITVLNR